MAAMGKRDTAEGRIEISNVSFHYGRAGRVLDGVNLRVESNEFVSIIGASGCGKSTLLKVIAGMLRPAEGEVSISGHLVTGPREDASYVFQKPVLLEWRTVMDNVLLPLELKHKKIIPEQRIQAERMLQLVGLEGCGDSYPHELSGGMLSRASLARALVTDPQILLMDEPFAALDAITKQHLQLELASIYQEKRATIVFITHDIQEAVFLSDRVILLEGSPSQVAEQFVVPFPHPRSASLKFDPAFSAAVKKIYERIENVLRGGAQ
jgi:NitT/TauT family transport system ATP-binding protein